MLNEESMQIWDDAESRQNFLHHYGSPPSRPPGSKLKQAELPNCNCRQEIARMQELLKSRVDRMNLWGLSDTLVTSAATEIRTILDRHLDEIFRRNHPDHSTDPQAAATLERYQWAETLGCQLEYPQAEAMLHNRPKMRAEELAAMSRSQWSAILGRRFDHPAKYQK